GARARARGPLVAGAVAVECRPRLALGGPLRPAREPARPRARRPARDRRLTIRVRSRGLSPGHGRYARSVSVELTVVGSINLDLVARVERLPRPGETVPGTAFDRIPGGKGANQAVAAARLGARVRMVGAVGTDPLAEEALTGLDEAGVELDLERVDTTGIAMILVDARGENQIVVVPG